MAGIKQTPDKEVEASSGRRALHKAAFSGHTDAVRFLLGLLLDVDL